MAIAAYVLRDEVRAMGTLNILQRTQDVEPMLVQRRVMYRVLPKLITTYQAYNYVPSL